MKELIAFVLPPAVGLVGTRLNRMLFGEEFEAQFGGGMKFALGLASGMLVLSQTVLLGVVAGFNVSGSLALLALLWGATEFVLLATRRLGNPKPPKVQPAHLWLLLLLPVAYSWWVFGKLSTLEGTLEFDANAFWVFKSKIFYLSQGENFEKFLHLPNLSFPHWDYPLLVSCLYTLSYGAAGEVNEFLNKVWPFWMVIALCLGILSLGNVWKRPHPLPIAAITLFCFLPASLRYIRWEGGCVPMAFYASLAVLSFVRAFAQANVPTLAVGVLVLVGCATTKLEGIVYAAVWLMLLLPICWRRGWLKHPAIWKVAIAAIVCLVPYALFRLSDPPLTPESGWWRSVITAPGAVTDRFPQVWFLNIFGRFFGNDFFHWEAVEHSRLKWVGEWSGWNSLVNEDLAILSWLALLLLAVGLFKKPDRPAVTLLTAATLGVISFLAFVISCLPSILADLSRGIDYSRFVVGRYYYPFFAAWFLGLVSIWFPNADTSTHSQHGKAVEKRAVSHPPSTAPRKEK